MIAALFTGIAASPLARAALRFSAVALAIVLFLLSIRRTGERVGRLAERLETSEEVNDVQRQMLGPRLAVLGLATNLATGCATVDSEPRIVTVCPPVVEYSREFQARTTEELVLLPERSSIAEMLGDYSVMRDQARACKGR